MSIPISTTTVTVLRVPGSATRDPYDPEPAATTVAAGVPAHISTSYGREQQRGGSQSVTSLRLSCDPIPAGLLHTDRILDDKTGEVYEVTWAVARFGLGMDHLQGGLRQVSGVIDGGG